MLSRLGAPADELARDGALIRELLRLTEGEPLLVGLYADQLWDAAGRLPVGARIARGDLASMGPGLAGFFDRWLAQHDEQLRSSGREPDVAATESVLAVLAHALGPLEEGLLLAVARDLLGQSASVSERIVRDLGRLVMGNGSAGSGYVLAHPALTVHLKELRLRAEGRRVHALFVSLARKPDTAELDFSQAPYIVQHLAEHMRQAGCPAKDFAILITDARRRAWAREGSGDQGFAADVQAALLAFSAFPAREAVGLWLNCALILSTIRSKNGSAPLELITACLRAGVMSKREALSRAQAMPYRQWRFEVLLNVLEIFGYDEEAAEVALGLASQYSWDREAFAKLARLLPPDAITVAIETASTFVGERVRSTLSMGWPGECRPTSRPEPSARRSERPQQSTARQPMRRQSVLWLRACRQMPQNK